MSSHRYLKPMLLESTSYQKKWILIYHLSLSSIRRTKPQQCYLACSSGYVHRHILSDRVNYNANQKTLGGKCNRSSLSMLAVMAATRIGVERMAALLGNKFAHPCPVHSSRVRHNPCSYFCLDCQNCNKRLCASLCRGDHLSHWIL
jgi:hypothetical protein